MEQKVFSPSVPPVCPRIWHFHRESILTSPIQFPYNCCFDLLPAPGLLMNMDLLGSHISALNLTSSRWELVTGSPVMVSPANEALSAAALRKVIRQINALA